MFADLGYQDLIPTSWGVMLSVQLFVYSKDQSPELGILVLSGHRNLIWNVHHQI